MSNRVSWLLTGLLGVCMVLATAAAVGVVWFGETARRSSPAAPARLETAALMTLTPSETAASTMAPTWTPTPSPLPSSTPSMTPEPSWTASMTPVLPTATILPMLDAAGLILMCDCSGSDVDCPQFASWDAAQECLVRCGNNIFDLDGDENGVACEALRK